MAEKKIEPSEKGGKKFRIVIDARRKGNFPDQREVEVILSDASIDTLDVFHKNIPSALKDVQYKGKKVRWFNNFGMKKKGGSKYEAEVPGYTVILEKVDGAEYVYYDGPVSRFDSAGLHALPVQELNATQVQATLTRGDPAVGWIK